MDGAGEFVQDLLDGLYDQRDLLPDLSLRIDELYWLDDAPGRSRVAVRYRLRGTAAVDGRARPVSVMGVHHVHVRGELVVAEWAELDELALHAQLQGASPGRYLA